MRQKKLFLSTIVVLCICLAPMVARAQISASETGMPTSAPPEEHKLGDYFVAGSIEAGYRFSDVRGSSFNCGGIGGICNYVGTYDSMVNLRQGPRVFDQSLSLRSATPGGLFDSLYTSTFGWGGDPENVARLRMTKRKIYNFTVLFRRDYSVFDYNLLANPLNPLTSASQLGQTTAAQLTSPHTLNTVRRMSDVGLQLFPLSKISVRLGYNRVRYESNSADSFTSIHLGTEFTPNLIYNFTNQQYRAGVDLKFIPRTTISFDGIVSHYKNDTNAAMLSFPGVIAGVPASEGVAWNTLIPGTSSQPCAIGALNTLRCNVLTSFSRSNRFRSTTPTIMASLESHYWQRLDITAHATYGWSDLSGPFLQSWTGFQTRGTVIAERDSTSPLRTHSLTSNADVGATYHVTDHIRISDTFRFVNQRYPTFGIFQAITTPGSQAGTATGPPAFAAGSPAGVTQALDLDTKLNETTIGFDIGKHVGLDIGYRYTHRIIFFLGQGFDVDTTTGEPVVPFEPEGGFDRFEIPQHTALGSVWFQPSSKFRISADAELSSAGISWHNFDPTTTPVTDVSLTGLTTFTRITPRHEQQYRARATFQPARHVAMTAGVNIWEQRNTFSTIQYRFHNRNYGFTATITPTDRIAVDLGYNYQDILQNDLICFVAGTTAGSFPGSAVASAGTCPNVTGYLGAFGDYTDQSHFGSAMLRVQPVKRLTVAAGYSIVHNDGGFTNLNALNPSGPTKFEYIRPMAAVTIDMLHGLAIKGSYDYYDYNEGGSSAALFGTGGPTMPRDFHAHIGTLALRYSF